MHSSNEGDASRSLKRKRELASDESSSGSHERRGVPSSERDSAYLEFVRRTRWTDSLGIEKFQRCDEHAGDAYTKARRTPAFWKALEDLGMGLAEALRADTLKLRPCFERVIRAGIAAKASDNAKAQLNDLDLETLVQAAREDSDLGHYFNNDMSDEQVARKLFTIVPDESHDSVFYSFCWDQFQQENCTWHCRRCGKCADWLEWHCSGCNRCHYGKSFPCSTCDPHFAAIRESVEYE